MDFIVKKFNVFKAVHIKNATFEIQFVKNPKNEVIGIAVFVNDKLLDLDKLSEVHVIEGNTINNISLDEFTIKAMD